MSAPALVTTLPHRPMRPDDAQRWADLLAAVEAADRRGEHYDAADCAEELAEPDVDFARDSVLVFDGDRAVAYQVLRAAGPPGARVLHTDAAVHPDHRGRGIGSAMLDLARARATELGADLHVRVPESVPAAVALAEGAGLVPVRWWSELSRDLAEPVAPVAPPAGLALHALGPDYDAARWDEPLRLARNVAFAEHWGSVPVGPTEWAHVRTGSRNFRPDCSSVACTADGEVAGLLMAQEFLAESARAGRRDLYVDTVGTLPGWRGRGVAAALLADALQRARDLGFATSSLTVDAQNPTGALGVYVRAGYRLDSRQITYAPPR